MKAMDYYLFVLGVISIILAILQVLIPGFLISKELLARMKEHKTKIIFQRVSYINWFVLGSILIAGAFLQERLKLLVCIPLIVVAGIVKAFCNKKLLGTWWAYISKTK